MKELPGGWAWAQFREVALIASDLVNPASWPNARHVAPNHIESGTGRLTGVSTVAADGVTSPKHRFREGQLLYSKIRPYLAKAVVAPYSGLCSADMYPIDSLVDSRYLLHWMLSDDFTAFAAAHQGRSVLPKINQLALNTLPVPVAPVDEQRRIVAAIEEVFSKLDAGEAGLRTVRQLLKRMRVTILAAAVTGRLVPQDPTDTPGGKLLADLGVGVLDAPGLLTLPSSWSWARVCDVGAVDLGRQRSPKYHTGDNMKPYLRVANVFEDRIDTTDVMEMHFEPEAFERSRLVCGDILLNEGQTPELLGRPAMYRGDPPDVAFTNSLLRFRCMPGIEPELALLVFRHHMHSGRFTRESRITTNIAHLSASRFKPVEFPVPPTSEQVRVVTEFERLSSFLSSCDRAVDAGLARSAALRRSVLKAAFEGRLVPQDSSDEPALVLLDRIQARLAAVPKPSRKRKTTTENDDYAP
jgi:type I restriction enzyme, S subunit